MKIGKVTGTVVCSVKDKRLEGLKLLVVQEYSLLQEATQAFHVAADTVQAGPGDLVLFASGSSARNTDKTSNKAVDCTIIAIVDSIHLNEAVLKLA
ncbi:MAG: EutN/CcmL family microcompartment protein [Candidatus Cloacimonetes bacterium]|nr:EutN/CcmL family microcompartment protein [Candidatus Cloacimonadota bacterium]